MICAYTYLKRRDGLPPAAGEARIVQDALWVHSTPEHGLQHVRVKAEGGGMALHVFFHGTEAGATSLRLERLVASLRHLRVFQAYEHLSVPAGSSASVN